jgi:hypothetical protein
MRKSRCPQSAPSRLHWNAFRAWSCDDGRGLLSLALQRAGTSTYATQHAARLSERHIFLLIIDYCLCMTYNALLLLSCAACAPLARRRVHRRAAEAHTHGLLGCCCAIALHRMPALAPRYQRCPSIASSCCYGKLVVIAFSYFLESVHCATDLMRCSKDYVVRRAPVVQAALIGGASGSWRLVLNSTREVVPRSQPTTELLARTPFGFGPGPQPR